MEKCGAYTTDRPLGWGRSATYYTGTGGEANRQGRIVIRCSRSTDRRQLHSCLFSAAEQQAAASSGCRRLAPILDFGIAESGRAYHVTRGYETSAGECIKAGNFVDAEALKSIVTGILKALTELWEKCRRAHGNLTAGNILLDESGEVILTDLAPKARDASHTDDLQALGLLIYQLVRRSLNIGHLSPPLEHSHQWTESLGDEADNWRAFTNRMLLSNRAQEKGLLAAAWQSLKKLESLADEEEKEGKEERIRAPISHGPPSSRVVRPKTETHPRKRRRSRFGLVALLLVVLGAGGGLMLWKRPQPEPEKPKPKEDPPDVAAAKLKQLIPDATYEKLKLGRLKNEATPLQIESRLRNWEIADKLKELIKTWQDRKWDQLAGALATRAIIGGEEMTGQAQFDRLSAALKDAERAFQLRAAGQDVEDAWKSLQATRDRLKDLGMDTIPDFSNWAESQLTQPAGGDALAILEAAKKRGNEAESRLSAFISYGLEYKKRLRLKAFADVAKSLGNTSKDPNWPDLWKKAMEESQSPEDGQIATWNTRFSLIKERIADRPIGEQEALNKRLEDLQLDVSESLKGKEKKITDAIDTLLNEIRIPIVELDAEYRKLASDFKDSVSKATSTDMAKNLLKDFRQQSTDLFGKPEYKGVDSEFLNYYGFKLTVIYDTFTTATGASPKPVYELTNNNWKLVGETATSATYRMQNEVLTFHLLSNKTAAIAAVETTATLAAIAGTPPPPVNAAGFLSTRGTWLWSDARDWNQAYSKKYAAQNKTLENVIGQFPNSAQCPINWVRAIDAKQIAARLGARLPTPAEWNDAQKLSKQANFKLRTGRYTTISNLITAEFDSAAPLTRFDVTAGAFIYPRTLAPAFQGNVTDRDFLWFSAVPNDQTGVQDLVGNASEWVADETGNYIVGGSCLTPPDASFLKAALQPADKAYCDVSFRLAVSVKPGSADAGLKALQEAVIKEFAPLNTKDPIKAPLKK